MKKKKNFHSLNGYDLVKEYKIADTGFKYQRKDTRVKGNEAIEPKTGTTTLILWSFDFLLFASTFFLFNLILLY